jgi:hypothetical protein
MNQSLIDMASYIAKVSPKGVNKVAYKYGYPLPLTEEGRLGFIIKGFSEEGDEFLRDLALVHPDRDLIISASEISDADGSNTQLDIINVSDLKGEFTKPQIIVKENSDTIKLVILLVVAFVIYKILS